jgi:hypothetical protein
MIVDPAVELAKLRRERRAVIRVLRVSGPIAALGMLMLFFADSHLSDAVLELIALPTFVAFIVTFIALALLGGIRGRDIANRFRPGSARAYDDE